MDIRRWTVGGEGLTLSVDSELLLAKMWLKVTVFEEIKKCRLVMDILPNETDAECTAFCFYVSASVFVRVGFFLS